MKLTDVIYNFIEETGIEIKKDKNMILLREKIINPVVKEIIDELYPYIIKVVISSIFIILILLITIILNIRVILKN